MTMLPIRFFASVCLAFLCLMIVAPAAQSQEFLDQFQEETDDAGTNELMGQEKASGVVNQYDKSYLQSANPIEINRGLLPTARYLVRFVRTADAKPGEATLRLTSPVMINGCVDVQNPGVAIQQNGQLLMITVGEPALKLTDTVRYAHFQCDQRGQTASADIIFDQKKMMADEIMTVMLQAGPFTDYYDVEVTSDTLTLKPKTTNPKTKAFEPYFRPGATEPLTYHNYPDNLVVLDIPSAKPGQKIAQALEELARSKGLAGGSALPSYLQNGTGQDNGKYYFIDKRSQYSGKIAFGKPDFFGTVTVAETLRGPQGSYDVPQVLDVYIKRPGEFD